VAIAVPRIKEFEGHGKDIADKANKYLTRRKLCVIIQTVNAIRATAKTVNLIAKSAVANVGD